MSRRCKYLIVLIAAIAFGTQSVPAHAIQVGDSPELIVKQLDSHSFNLSRMRGKVVIIQAWASWCSHCHDLMTTLDTFAVKHRDVKVLALSFDHPYNTPRIRDMMQNFFFPVAMAGDAERSDFTRPKVLPTLYVIDKKGVLNATISPEDKVLDEAALDEVILPLLK